MWHFSTSSDITVSVLKFRTLFFFCWQIKFWLSGLKSQNAGLNANREEDPDQTASEEVV